MTFEDKKAQVYRLVKLGMDREEAELLSEFTLEEQERLDTDAFYLSRCKLQRLIEERDLLESLDDIANDNAIKGVSTEIRWKLERMNPARWGKSLAIATTPAPVENEIPDLSSLSKEERALLLSVVTRTLSNGANK